MYDCCSYAVDYDVTAFINGVEPPFKRVIDDFQDIILKNFDVDESNMKVSPRSIQFNLDGIEFDLLPATNMSYQGQGRHRDTIKTQNETHHFPTVKDTLVTTFRTTCLHVCLADDA